MSGEVEEAGGRADKKEHNNVIYEMITQKLEPLSIHKKGS